MGRPLTLIAESDLNDPAMITPVSDGGLGMDAQWSDDFHHAVHVRLTGETSGYYADFAAPDALEKVLTKGFFHDGTWSSFRDRDHGRPIDTASVEAWRLVVCSRTTIRSATVPPATGCRRWSGIDNSRSPPS